MLRNGSSFIYSSASKDFPKTRIEIQRTLPKPDTERYGVASSSGLLLGVGAVLDNSQREAVSPSDLVTRIDIASVIDGGPISAVQIRVWLLCGLVAILDGLDTQVIGVAGPSMATGLGLSPAGFAPVFSAGLLGAAIGALLFGPLADRVGRKPMLVSATALFGLFTCLTAVADSVVVLLTYRFLAGLGLGGAIPCFIALGAEYAPARRRAMLTSLIWAGYPLGIAIGGFVNSYLISNFEWPVLFYAAGLPTLAASLLLLVFLPESLRFLASSESGRKRAERILRELAPEFPEGPVDILPSEEPGASRGAVSTLALFKEGRAPATILLGVMLLLAFAATTVIVLQVPTLLQAANVPLGTSAALVGIYSLVAVFSMGIAGRITEQFGAARVLVSVYVFGGVLLASLGSLAGAPLAAAVVMALIGATIPLGVAGSIALTATYYPTAMRSAGTGWVMGLGRFGQFLSPLVVGVMLLLDWAPAGIFLAMGIAPILAGVCVVLYAALPRRVPTSSFA
jgi:AAHS family 4-hydroxybenzoate transporter-like MFS transporter